MPELLNALIGRSQYTPLAVRPFYMVGRPGFFGAFGSWLDVFSPLAWNYGRLPDQVDYDATMLGLDWQFVGMDMQAAIAEQAKAIAA